MKINLVVLGGNLVRDPDLRYTPSGTAICDFTIANSESYKNNAGEWVENPGFYNCFCWGRKGEVISEHFSKGKPICITGRLVFQQWETTGGEKRNAVKVKVTDFDFIGHKQQGEPVVNDDVPEEEIPF